jgi:uncharacterized membrane protein YebE (DUF533 family)
MLDIRGCGFHADMVKAAVMNSSLLIELQADDLGDGEEAQTIRDKLAENGLRSALFKSAAGGIQRLSPVMLPLETGQEITEFLFKLGGSRALRNMAYAGFEPSQQRATGPDEFNTTGVI